MGFLFPDETNIFFNYNGKVEVAPGSEIEIFSKVFDPAKESRINKIQIWQDISDNITECSLRINDAKTITGYELFYDESISENLEMFIKVLQTRKFSVVVFNKSLRVKTFYYNLSGWSY